MYRRHGWYPGKELEVSLSKLFPSCSDWLRPFNDDLIFLSYVERDFEDIQILNPIVPSDP